MAETNFVEDIIEEIPATNDAETESESENDAEIEEVDFSFDGEESENDDIEEFIHIDETSGDVERIVDVLGGIFVNADGDTICDVLTNINENIDKHNKLMYRISQDLRALISSKAK